MASRSPVFELLWSVPLFARCSARDLRVLARHVEVAVVEPGTEIVREGEQGEVFYVVLRGEATVVRNGRTVRKLGPGDHFGELALLAPGPRAASVRAVTQVEVGALGHRMFKVLLRDMPTLSAGLLTALALELRDALGRQAI